MKFKIRFKTGTGLGSMVFGSVSVYTLKAFCVHIVDRYNLSEKEIETIIHLKPGEKFKNEDLQITPHYKRKNNDPNS
jgi:hypothetical protein